MSDTNLSREEATEIAEEAAAKALSQLFQYLDVDLKDQESLREFRQDLDHLRRTRKDVEKARGIIRWGALGLLVSLMPAGLVWLWNIFIPWVQKQ